MIPNSIFLGVALFIGLFIGASYIEAILELTHEVAKKGCIDNDSDEWRNWEKYVTTQSVRNWGLKGIAIIALLALIAYNVTSIYAVNSKEIDWSILTSTFIIFFFGAPFARGIWEAYGQVKSHGERNEKRR